MLNEQNSRLWKVSLLLSFAKLFGKVSKKSLLKNSNLAKCLIWPKGELLPNATALLSPTVTYTFTFSFLNQLHG